MVSDCVKESIGLNILCINKIEINCLWAHVKVQVFIYIMRVWNDSLGGKSGSDVAKTNDLLIASPLV